MNRAWTNLEKAPVGTFKSKIHKYGVKYIAYLGYWALLVLSHDLYLVLPFVYRLGLRLLSRVKPTENLLKSISKEITKVEVTYPMRFSLLLVHSNGI